MLPVAVAIWSPPVSSLPTTRLPSVEFQNKPSSPETAAITPEIPTLTKFASPPTTKSSSTKTSPIKPVAPTTFKSPKISASSPTSKSLVQPKSLLAKISKPSTSPSTSIPKLLNTQLGPEASIQLSKSEAEEKQSDTKQISAATLPVELTSPVTLKSVTFVAFISTACNVVIQASSAHKI